MTHRSSSFHYFQPQKTPSVPTPRCGCMYWRCLRFQMAEATVGPWASPGFLPAPSIPRHNSRTHAWGLCTAPKGSLHPHFLGMCGQGEAGAPARGSSGVRSCRGTLARGSGPVCCCKDDFDLLPSSGKSKVVGRTEEITEHVSSQRYHPPPGNPLNMGEGFLCQKAQPAVFPKGSLGLQASTHNKEHLLACSAFY